MRPFRCALLLLLALPWFMPLQAESLPIDERLREVLRHRLEVLDEPGELAGGRILHAAAPLRALYRERGWRPLWFGAETGSPASLSQVLSAIDLAFEHGLEPADYHRRRLAELLGRRKQSPPLEADPRLRADIELLASDALLTLADHLAHGRVDPETIDPEWFISRDSTALLDRLAEAAKGENLALRDILQRLLPTHAEYATLVDRLSLQRTLARSGEWAMIEGGALLRPGQSDARVPQIRRRLIALGDLGGGEELTSDQLGLRYDPLLEEAVKRFQQRHGLAADGIVGPRTLAALNVSPASRIDQLRANLERWRWLPRSLGEEYILVNIAGFNMAVFRDGEALMKQRVVVGTPYRRTPVFSGRMSYLVLNPSWEVPHKLAVEDQLPRIRENPAYLEEMGFSVLRGWGVDEQRIEPAAVDWSALSARNFPYRLRQAPGPLNALGRVKFMFPNPHSVYLHDTPSRGLFSEENRARSSGCIRVEEPERLMTWLLTERSRTMTPERLAVVVESGVETTVPLDEPLPVHLLYWTAWVDDHGIVQYRDDVYQRDGRLIEALDSDLSPDA